jgi:hypothetical protein
MSSTNQVATVASERTAVVWYTIKAGPPPEA